MWLKVYLAGLLLLIITCNINQAYQNSHDVRIKRHLKSPSWGLDGPYLTRYVVPIGYHVHLQPFPHERQFFGKVEMNISCLFPTNTIILHCGEQLKVTKAKISFIRPTGFYANFRKIQNISVQRVQRVVFEDWCEVSLSHNIETDMHYQLTLEFSGSIGNTSSEGGIYVGNYAEDHTDQSWYITANLQQNKARKAFPCFDEFQYKAPFKISIGRLEDMTSLSNMALERMEKMTDHSGWVWDHFERSLPMSPFSVNFIIFDPMDLVPIKNNDQLDSTLHIYGQPHLVEKLEVAMDALFSAMKKAELYLQTKYPLPDFQVLVVPGLQNTNDAFGIKLIRENDINTRTWPLPLVSDIVDQWMIHLATPHFWSETSFANSLSNYITTVVLFESLTVFKNSEESNWETILFNVLYENSQNDCNRELNFTKDLWLFRMLNYTLTENTLRNSLKHFLYEKSCKTYVLDDVLEAISKQAQQDWVLSPDVSVPEVVNSWLQSDRFPVISVFRNYKDRTAHIEQQVFIRDEPKKLTEKEKNYQWFVPIMMKSGDHPEKQDVVAWMKQERTIKLYGLPEIGTFIMINPDNMGMYVVNYDPENWSLLIHHLWNESSSWKLSPASRAKLITDAFLLSDAGELQIGTLLDLTLSLQNDFAYAPWYAYSNAFWRLFDKLKNTRTRTRFEDYTRRLISPLYEQNGGYSVALDEDVSSVEGIIQNIMCYLGAEDCMDALIATYTPEIHTSCIILQWGPRDLWDSTLHWALSDNKNYNMLTELAQCTQDQERMNKFLQDVLLKYTINDDDILFIVGNVTNPYMLFNYISDKWFEIKKRYSHKQRLLESLIYITMSKFVTSDGHDLVSKFYIARQNDNPNLMPYVKKAMDEIVKNSKWYDRNLPQIESWLNKFFVHSI